MRASTSLARLVVLISGNGSNLQAIIDACQQQQLAAQVVAVVSNNNAAYGLERARQAEIPTLVQAPKTGQTRAEYDQTLAGQIAHYQPDWIILAGWMRILSNRFLQYFPQRVINLHPALPGQFPGVNAIARAYHAYQQGLITYTGVMVHLVNNEQVDCGPVLNQIEVPIEQQDTLATLTQRIQQAEHALLVNTLRSVLSNKKV